MVPADSIVLDSTIQPAAPLNVTTNGNGQKDYGIDSALGKFIPGGNLFFSFSQFGLLTGESATFTDHAGLGVQNILARVTGSGVSNIDGAINVDILGANLFLMNPAGFIFGSSASVNITGSFAVTTADYLKFADGKRFTAASGPEDATLSAAAVSAFGFLSGKRVPPAPVSFSGGSYSGTSVTVVAGDQLIDGTSISAPGGQLALVSVAGPGEVPAVPATLTATPLEALPALGSVTVQDFAFISTGSFGTAATGHLEIDAGSITVLRSVIDASSFAIPSGSPTVGASSILLRGQTLLVGEGATISGNASGFGQGGTIDIQAQNVTVTDAGSPGGLIASTIATVTFDQAIGGSITVTADTLSITGSLIQTSAFGSGTAGNIRITVGSLSISALRVSWRPESSQRAVLQVLKMQRGGAAT
ncbi:MAG: filamentous hemagglutinin N-terminal domain-containing protein [Chthoniobacter sp.]